MNMYTVASEEAEIVVSLDDNNTEHKHNIMTLCTKLKDNRIRTFEQWSFEHIFLV